MLRFQDISHLFALGLLPLLVILFIAVVYWRRRKIKKLGDERLVSEQILGFIPGRSAFKFILLLVAFSAVVIGWANLQMGDKTEKGQRKGIDVVIALDVSKSMLAKDVQPDRLTRAKQLIMRMLEKMQNDRVALIVFAGRAYQQVPLTVDYGALKMLLQNVGPDLVPTQGTVIGDAIDMALKSYSQQEKKYKSMVIISDGEDHDEQAIAKTREAADEGVVVHTVGIGSPQGATLYDPDTKSVKLDEKGNPVVSRLNEDELRSIASAGHGTYTQLQNPDEVAAKLVGELDGMEQKSLGAVEFSDYASYFQYFLVAGLLALLVEWILPGSNVKVKAGRINKSLSILCILVFLVGITAHAQTRKLMTEGNQNYKDKKYKEAATDYTEALKKDSTYTPGMFNLGNSLYQQKQYDASREVMSNTARAATDKGSKAKANYTIGNTYMEQQKWDDAVNAYKETLRNNPQDADAKYNLSYAMEKLKQQQQQNKNDKNKNDKNKDQKNKDQQKKDQQNKDDKNKKDDKDKNKDQQNKDKDKKDKNDKDQQQPQSQPSKLSKQQADQLLNALQQEEKKLQDKKKKEAGVPVKLDKDW